MSDGGDADPARVGHFRILGRLGAGGMGVVYRAHDETLRRDVALKLLTGSTSGRSEERLQRFLREARSAAGITHPNVAVVHQVGAADGRVYIAMELIEGQSLRQRLDHGPLDVATARDWAAQIARGLAAAHEKEVVHRDLKPENVMITTSGVIKLLDFGLAKTADVARTSEDALARTETAVTSDANRIMGTPEYMSPEQAMGAALTIRSDVFSFGTVLYEMLCGRRPFSGATQAVLIAIARDAHVAVRERNPALPTSLEAIVDRCLAKAPEDRYASAAEVARALAAEANEGVPTHDDAPRRQPAVRRRGLATLGAAAIVGAALAAWHLGSQRSAREAPPATAREDARLGVAITDHPSPRTSIPAAAEAYAAGLRHLRDGEDFYAPDDFARAATADPAMAAAALRVVLYGGIGAGYNSSAADQRRWFALAFEHRATLDARDRALLRVAEARVADPPLPKEETLSRARAALDAFPDDAEAAYVAASELAFLPSDTRAQLEAQRQALLRVLDLDPQFAAPLVALAKTYSVPGPESEEGLAVVRRCLEVSPSAGACLRFRVDANMELGRCDEVERDARRLTVLEPSGHRTYELFADALAARGAPVEAVAEALAKRVPLEPNEGARRRAEVQNTLWTAVLAGDLDAAEGATWRLDDLTADSLAIEDHAVPYDLLLDVLEEEGATAKAVQVVDAFARRSAGWAGQPDWWDDLRAATVRLRAGRIDAGAYRRLVDAQRSTGAAREETPLAYWRSALEFVATPEEATAALARRPDGDVTVRLNPMFVGRWVGRTYLLAGQTDAALPLLRAAAASCQVLPSSTSDRVYTVWWMRAHVDLGLALEQTGDLAGACSAYGVVLDRWRNARPRSVSLERARQRSRVIGCGG